MNLIDQSMKADDELERELVNLKEEMYTLSPLQMDRKAWIKSRIEAIGKERLELFLERRRIRDAGLFK